jgi:segregation and condensation protein A
MHKIKLERFEGPLDLLLQLIEKHELDITEVALAEVTEQYLDFLDHEADLPPSEMADFLVIAAKLLLIKSRVLLPQLFVEEGEDDAKELREQLAIYKLYLSASENILSRYQSKTAAFAREKLPKIEIDEFNPPANVISDNLQVLFAGLLESLEKIVEPEPEVIKRTVSLRERISKLRQLFKPGSRMTFNELLSDVSNRTDIIVSFLAILELVKQRQVVARQDEEHGIVITGTSTMGEIDIELS